MKLFILVVNLKVISKPLTKISNSRKIGTSLFPDITGVRAGFKHMKRVFIRMGASRTARVA